MSKVLHLTLKKRWFDLIACGEKKEEYRELKPYWAKRLVKCLNTYRSENCLNGIGYGVDFNSFDVVHFRNGYAKNAPLMIVEFKGISIGKPAFKWYGNVPTEETFIISLGNILSIQNYNPSPSGSKTE